MSRSRLFDHEEALARWRAGETQTQIAASCGVTPATVSMALNRLTDPDWAEKKRTYNREWQRDHLRRPCVRGCGRDAWHQYGRPGICRQCAAAERTTTVRADTLRCSECGEWLPDASFPNAKKNLGRRGRHATCRGCQSAVRARSRARQKTPCVSCGTPRLANPRNVDNGLCRVCWQNRNRQGVAA